MFANFRSSAHRRRLPAGKRRHCAYTQQNFNKMTTSDIIKWNKVIAAASITIKFLEQPPHISDLISKWIATIPT